MHIAIDFDGCICESKYPDLGDILPNAKEVINYWHERGHKIIINTCRTKHYAENAKAYLIQKGIKFDNFNENSTYQIEKYGMDTRKISADVYIDDRNINDLTIKRFLGKEQYNNELWQTSLEQLQVIEKPCIICIVGESGVGKSVSAEYLEFMYDINLIQSYTDREKRSSDERGHTFLKKSEFDNVMETGEVLAYTKYGENRYFCLTDDLLHINSYVINEDGIEMLKREWGERYDIYTLRIKRPLFSRIESVGEARVSRDEGRFTMLDNQFDYIIENDGNTLEYLYKKIEDFMGLFNLKERSKEYNIFI